MQARTCFAGTQLHTARNSAMVGNKLSAPAAGALVVMRKKDIHPEIFKEVKVICKGEEVMVVDGTVPEYNVDIWSGNHPFYQGIKTTMIMDDGQVDKFEKKFGGLDMLGLNAQDQK